nr:hypothetical protein CFP56_60104 [Quercus suber]
MTAMKMVGLESGLTWIIKVLGLEVGVGEGVEAVGLSGFVVEVVAVAVVGLPIWFWWAMGCGSSLKLPEKLIALLVEFIDSHPPILSLQRMDEGERIFSTCETEKGLVLRDTHSENGSGGVDVANWCGGANGAAELLTCQGPTLELQGSGRDCGVFEIV